ncbi:sulfoacetaldehyde dehydrogenase SafD [Halioxenophilus sp. WMMB6]|uniref:sulfoacetaldehyde dehydrogenase SafD n=1 Tax=Halioxenophilus sp. WMMB6 TaxID=3073815 RepID=UPI00295F5298|nr:aldehyde dehydrogenase family protein [Halioxenophilus sp. WMMB6]
MSNHYDVRNPYTQEHLGQFNYDDWSSLSVKLELLEQGQQRQRCTTANERANILRKLAGLLEQNAERLAQLITAETGKTISDSRVELTRAINAAIASSEEARQISGECLDSDCFAPARGKLGVVLWRPLGTVLCITPFNFPINIAMHKIGPAFAAGNTILFKSSPQNTASSLLFTELCYQAGMDQQVLQFCMPAFADLDQLNAHPSVNCINFTGSTQVANAIAAVSGYKKLLLELGGNDPLIVMPDGDVEAAVNATINQRFATAGQRCTAAKRVFVHQQVYSEFRNSLLAKTQQLKVGDPMDEQTFVGPVIHQGAAQEVERLVNDAVARGAQVTIGHQYDGALVYPTILEAVPADALLMREELFGPVVPLYAFTELDEIVPIINNSCYGLQAGLFTQNLAVIRQLFEALDVGTLACNDGPGFRTEHFPFGGVKESGTGREGIKYAIREMSFTKTLVI